MKKRLISALYTIYLLCLFSTPVWASDIKVGIMDTNRVVYESKAGENARTVLSKEIKTRQEAFTAKQKDVQALKEELESMDKAASSVAYNKKTIEYSQASKELSRIKEDLEEELNAEETELSQKMLIDISAVVSELCKKEKYTIILEKKNVAAFDSAVDVTEKIIQLYDSAQGAVK
ncbi:MAG: OmpH family outer membrane protein [Deltaproteobacteria bacterium]|nr:OmpH family outer membrane protein [Deltaproteobacteria bacterium]